MLDVLCVDLLTIGAFPERESIECLINPASGDGLPERFPRLLYPRGMRLDLSRLAGFPYQVTPRPCVKRIPPAWTS